MSYLPDPDTLTALGFTLARSTSGPDPSTTYQHSSGLAISWWPAKNAIRISHDGHTASGLGYRAECYTAPVADEAAFRALVARHFPTLTPTNPSHVHGNL